MQFFKVAFGLAHHGTQRAQALPQLSRMLPTLALSQTLGVTRPVQRRVRADRGGSLVAPPVAEPLCIVFEVTRPEGHLAAVHEQKAIGGGAQQVTIVRNHHQGAREILHRECQRVAHFQIEVVGRFVEQQ